VACDCTEDGSHHCPAHETYEETANRVGYALLERARTAISIEAALQLALTKPNIESSWRASHLYPFSSIPPYTEKREHELIIQLGQGAFRKKRVTRKRYPNGVVTLLPPGEFCKKTLQVTEKPVRIEMMHTLQGPVRYAVEEPDPNAEMDDYLCDDDDSEYYESSSDSDSDDTLFSSDTETEDEDF